MDATVVFALHDAQRVGSAGLDACRAIVAIDAAIAFDNRRLRSGADGQPTEIECLRRCDHVNGPEGACVHAAAATDAQRHVHADARVLFIVEKGARGASSRTGGLFALMAKNRGRGKLVNLNNLQTGETGIVGHRVLGNACSHAGFAGNAISWVGHYVPITHLRSLQNLESYLCTCFVSDFALVVAQESVAVAAQAAAALLSGLFGGHVNLDVVEVKLALECGALADLDAAGRRAVVRVRLGNGDAAIERVAIMAMATVEVPLI